MHPAVSQHPQALFSLKLVTLLVPCSQKQRESETHHRSERLLKQLHVFQGALVPEYSCPSFKELSRLT